MCPISVCIQSTCVHIGISSLIIVMEIVVSEGITYVLLHRVASVDSLYARIGYAYG